MSMPGTFQWVKAHAVRAVLAAYGVLIVINVFLTPLGDWLPMLVMGAVMGPAGYGIVRLVLGFQRVNRTTMKADTFRRLVTAAFWFGAVFAGLVLVAVIGSLSRGAQIGFGLALPAGWCLGAVDSWQDARYFAERDERDSRRTA